MPERFYLTPQQQFETAQRKIHDAELLHEGAKITELGDLAITNNQWTRLHDTMDADMHVNVHRQGEVNVLGGIASYGDMLDFAGHDKIRAVSMAFGSFFRPRIGQDDGMRQSGVKIVDPKGNEVTWREARLGGKIPVTSPNGSIYDGWGVIFESLAQAVETGRLHHIPDLRDRNGSYRFFENYVAHKLSLLKTDSKQ